MLCFGVISVLIQWDFFFGTEEVKDNRKLVIPLNETSHVNRFACFVMRGVLIVHEIFDYKIVLKILMLKSKLVIC